MNLIPNWRQAWRMFSVQAQAIAALVLGAWQIMPDDLRAALPTWAASAVAVVVLVLLLGGIVGRVIQQPEVHQ